MTDILSGIDNRTRIAGQNRAEMLLFGLGGKQRFAINVFKVREVIPRPSLTTLPGSSDHVIGVAHIRGKTVSIIDLASAIGMRPLGADNARNIVVTEFNRQVRGFALSDVDRIVNVTWDQIVSPPKGLSAQCYLTAVMRVNDELVQIIDVETVLNQVSPSLAGSEDLSKLSIEALPDNFARHVVFCDDSSIARKQVRAVLDTLGLTYDEFSDGEKTLAHLKAMGESGDIGEHVVMVISDIEMPNMDGYKLTREIRNDDLLKNLPVLLHTSLSGGFNEGLTRSVGADALVSKFRPAELADEIKRVLRSRYTEC